MCKTYAPCLAVYLQDWDLLHDMGEKVEERVCNDDDDATIGGIAALNAMGVTNCAGAAPALEAMGFDCAMDLAPVEAALGLTGFAGKTLADFCCATCSPCADDDATIGGIAALNAMGVTNCA